MKLEFLENINEYNEHAIRLYDFDSAQANVFRERISRFIVDKENSLDLSALDFIEPVNCQLILRTAEEDLGISTIDNIHFVCDLTVNSYKNITILLEPFCKKESQGYQWLYDIDTPIDLLFSAGGSW